MYLHNAADIDDILTYGINPLIEYLDIFGEECMDHAALDSKGLIFWTEIRGKALSIREAAKKVHKADLAMRRLGKDNPGKL